MTARDEAIEALRICDVDAPLGELIDAIPADVLARLAIERGGLESHTLREWWGLPDEIADVEETLYRLVTP